MKHEQATADSHGVRMVPFGAHIPRIIHQTYHSAELSPELQENVRQLRVLNPEWEYRFYDDADIRSFIDVEYGPAILARYDRLNVSYGAARADLFRYLLLYRFGGVYLDIKSGLTEPLDAVIAADDRFILSHWQKGSGPLKWGDHAELAHVPGGEYQQWHIISAAGHPFLRAVIESVLANIEDYRPWRQGMGRRAVLSVTGPIAYTMAIFPLVMRYPNREVSSEKRLGLRYSFMADFTHHRFFLAHYTQLSVPLVNRIGFRGMMDRGYARAMRWRDILAARTYPLRRRLRRSSTDHHQ